MLRRISLLVLKGSRLRVILVTLDTLGSLFVRTKSKSRDITKLSTCCM